MNDARKRFAPAAERNQQGIFEVLQQELPPSGLVLEVASGSGQHAIAMAARWPKLRWQPSDVDPSALESIAAYAAEADRPNLLPPVLLDTSAPSWPVSGCEAIVCVNMIHIAPWTACLGLLAGAARCLPLGAPLLLYGPFCIRGDYTAQSNIDFDRTLRAQDPAWGVRELDDIEAAANPLGLRLTRIVPRPANNHVVVFRQAQASTPGRVGVSRQGAARRA